MPLLMPTHALFLLRYDVKGILKLCFDESILFSRSNTAVGKRQKSASGQANLRAQFQFGKAPVRAGSR